MVAGYLSVKRRKLIFFDVENGDICHNLVRKQRFYSKDLFIRYYSKAINIRPIFH